MPDIFYHKLIKVGKAKRLSEFIQNHQFYFGLGQAASWNSSWGSGISDSNPPRITVDETFPSALIFKKAVEVYLAIEMQCSGEFSNQLRHPEVNGKRWSLLPASTLSDTQLRTILPQHVYLSVEFSQSDIPTPDFRAIGIFTHLTLKSGVNTQKPLFLPSEVLDPGILHWLSLSTPISRQSDTLRLEIVFQP